MSAPKFLVVVQRGAEPRHDARIVHALLPLVLDHLRNADHQSAQPVAARGAPASLRVRPRQLAHADCTAHA